MDAIGERRRALHGRMYRVLHGVVGMPMPPAVRGMRLRLPGGRRQHMRNARVRSRSTSGQRDPGRVGTATRGREGDRHSMRRVAAGRARDDISIRPPIGPRGAGRAKGVAERSPLTSGRRWGRDDPSRISAESSTPTRGESPCRPAHPSAEQARASPRGRAPRRRRGAACGRALGSGDRPAGRCLALNGVCRQEGPGKRQIWRVSGIVEFCGQGTGFQPEASLGQI